MNNNKNGYILISIMLTILCLTTILLSLSWQIIKQKELLHFEKQKLITQNLAFAGKAHGNYLSKDPAWHTDTYNPPQAQLKAWLLKNLEEGGSQGFIKNLESGKYKIIKITGQPFFYSIGFIGETSWSGKFKFLLKIENNNWSIL